MLDKLMNSPIAWLALSAVSVISLMFAIYTWIVGQKKKELSVSRKSEVIVKEGKNLINRFELRYNGQIISDLTSSKFYIWNSGNDVIDTKDIVESRSLCIVNTGNAEILDAQILLTSEPSNDFKITAFDSSTARLSFDYIEPGEGVLVQILHTGHASDLELNCKIKGGKDIRNCNLPKGDKGKSKGKIFRDFLLELWPTLLVIIFSGLALSVAARIKEIITNESLYMLLSIILISGSCILGISIATKMISKFNQVFHRSIPASLRNLDKT